MADMDTDTAVQDKLVSFIRARFLPDEIKNSFGPDSPLLELGVLDSLNAARLLNFIRRELGAAIPTAMIDPEHFANVCSITKMIAALAPSAQVS